MSDDDDDLQIEISDEVKEQMAQDPKMAEAIREFNAGMRQAHDAVKRGQYKTLDDAVEGITGFRPQKIDPETGEAIPGASLHDEHFGELGINIDSATYRKKPKPQ